MLVRSVQRVKVGAGPEDVVLKDREVLFGFFDLRRKKETEHQNHNGDDEERGRS